MKTNPKSKQTSGTEWTLNKSLFVSLFKIAGLKEPATKSILELSAPLSCSRNSEIKGSGYTGSGSELRVFGLISVAEETLSDPTDWTSVNNALTTWCSNAQSTSKLGHI